MPAREKPPQTQYEYLADVLDALAKGGWAARRTMGEVLEEAEAQDTMTVYLKRGREHGWLRVVWQGLPRCPYDTPAEVLSDFTVNLGTEIATVDARYPS